MEKNNNHPIQDLLLEEGQIIIYQPNETIKVEVKMEDETVWLTQAQIAVTNCKGVTDMPCPKATVACSSS